MTLRLRHLFACVLTMLTESGCINRPGMNLECVWPPEPVFQIDLKTSSDLRHLLRDIEVAEELTVRYRDEMGGRRPRPTLGIQFRTVASPRPASKFAEQCQTRLWSAISTAHGLQPDDVTAARPLLAAKGLDLAVSIPVLLVYVGLTGWALAWVRTRFETDEKWARRMAIVIASVGVCVAVVVFGAIWSGLVEIVRVGNEHLANRAARIAWPSRAPAVFAGGLVVFWVAALVTTARRRTLRTALCLCLGCSCFSCAEGTVDPTKFNKVSIAGKAVDHEINASDDAATAVLTALLLQFESEIVTVKKSASGAGEAAVVTAYASALEAYRYFVRFKVLQPDAVRGMVLLRGANRPIALRYGLALEDRGGGHWVNRTAAMGVFKETGAAELAKAARLVGQKAN